MSLNHSLRVLFNFLHKLFFIMCIHCTRHCFMNIILSYKSMFYRFECISHNHPITLYALFLTLPPLLIFFPCRWFCFYFHVYFMSHIHTYAQPYFTYLDRNHEGDELAWLGSVASHCSHLSWVPLLGVHSVWSSLLIGYHTGLHQWSLNLLTSKPTDSCSGQRKAESNASNRGNKHIILGLRKVPSFKPLSK